MFVLIVSFTISCFKLSMIMLILTGERTLPRCLVLYHDMWCSTQCQGNSYGNVRIYAT